MKWICDGFRSWKYVDGSGKIIGRVFKALGADYKASCNGDPIGDYIDEKSAKAAVHRTAFPNTSMSMSKRI